MNSQVNLRRLGLENSGPLHAGHPEVGQPCLLCKRPIQAGDETGHFPQDPEDQESAALVAHWKCIDDGFKRLRGSGSVAPGATRRFLESWAGGVQGGAASVYPYASQADFILKHGRAFEWRALPRGVRFGLPRQCFRKAVRLALRKPRFYTYVEGYAINTWVSGHPVAHAWCVDPECFVVDTTWEEGADYFGVPFRVEYVRRMAGARRDYGWRRLLSTLHHKYAAVKVPIRSFARGAYVHHDHSLECGRQQRSTGGLCTVLSCLGTQHPVTPNGAQTHPGGHDFLRVQSPSLADD